MATLKIQNVVKKFGALTVIPELSLTIQDQEFCVLVGPSGCGKSTLLRIISGLVKIDSGEILIDGENVSDQEPVERGIAMVFQSYALYPHMNVDRNMGFGLEIARTVRDEIVRRVGEAAKKLHLDQYLHRKPRELSGGQRQRVAIGRAITRKPSLFLLDEPLSNLDAALRVDMRVEIARLKAELNSTMIYVTHDQVEAMTLADRIVVMNEGRIEQVGTPMELYHQPANRFVAGFLGSPAMNFLKGKVIASTSEVASIQLDLGPTIEISVIKPLDLGSDVELGVRPEHIIFEEGNGFKVSGHLGFVEMLGSDTIVHITIGSETIVARDSKARYFSTGETLAIQIDSKTCYLFDQKGARVSITPQFLDALCPPNLQKDMT